MLALGDESARVKAIKINRYRCHQPTLVGVGVAAGLTAGLAAAFARKVVATLRVGRGHAAKHRILDVACAVLQPKLPLDAMSTYLNGFHMYADEMGRMVEATPMRG